MKRRSLALILIIMLSLMPSMALASGGNPGLGGDALRFESAAPDTTAGLGPEGSATPAPNGETQNADGGEGMSTTGTYEIAGALIVAFGINFLLRLPRYLRNRKKK